LSSIVEVRPTAAAAEGRFEIELGNGRRLRVPPVFEGAALKALLAILERRRDSARRACLPLRRARGQGVGRMLLESVTNGRPDFLAVLAQPKVLGWCRDRGLKPQLSPYYL
jgi:hypothetical protein